MDSPSENAGAPAPQKDLSTDSNKANIKMETEEANTIAEVAAAVVDEVLDEGITKDELLATDEASALKGLTENVRDQDDLERDITNQANLVMIEQEDERDQKRIDKVHANINKLEGLKRTKERRLDTLTNNPFMRKRCLEELNQIEADIAALRRDIVDIQKRIDERHQYDGAENRDQPDAAGGNKRMPNEKSTRLSDTHWQDHTVLKNSG
jgi:DNA excision repair protein ERCC-6